MMSAHSFRMRCTNPYDRPVDDAREKKLEVTRSLGDGLDIRVRRVSCHDDDHVPVTSLSLPGPTPGKEEPRVSDPGSRVC